MKGTVPVCVSWLIIQLKKWTLSIARRGEPLRDKVQVWLIFPSDVSEPHAAIGAQD